MENVGKQNSYIKTVQIFGISWFKLIPYNERIQIMNGRTIWIVVLLCTQNIKVATQSICYAHRYDVVAK